MGPDINVERWRKPMVLHRKMGVIGLGTLLVLSLIVWRGLPYGRPHVWHGFTMQPPKPATDFTLTAHTGVQASLHDFRGKLVLLYFGYPGSRG
jgi:cytochrome oxidase Cu insertion factor (SCO1/SenC/PrrC family)